MNPSRKRREHESTTWASENFWVAVTFLFIFSLALGAMVGTAEAKREFVRFGGGNPGGSWFTIAGGLSALLNKQIKDMNVTRVATGGSTDNNRLARKHELEPSLTHAWTSLRSHR